MDAVFFTLLCDTSLCQSSTSLLEEHSTLIFKKKTLEADLALNKNPISSAS